MSILDELPVFPNYRRIEIRDFDKFNEFYAQFEPYADHYFGNLFAWLDFHDDLSISNLNNNIVFQYTDVFSPKKGGFSYTLLGNNNPQQTLDLFYTNTKNSLADFGMVADEFIQSLNTQKYLVEEDRDDWDYIYDISELLALDGGNYQRLRYQLNHFNRNYKDVSKLERIDVLTLDNKQSLLGAYKVWSKEFSQGNDPEEIETHALQERLDLVEKIPLSCFELYVDDKLQAFLLYSYAPQADYVILHHLKCNYEFENIFDYLIYESAKYFGTQGKKYLNLEQDLGKPGLRKHKELLRPSKFLKKYKVSLKKS